MAAKILIIEDDELLNKLITSQLKKAGYDSEGVFNWAQAQAYLSQHEPSLIITDVRLPDGDSLEKIPGLAEFYPIIVLTAYGSVRNAVAVMKNGASDYLLKPVSPDELLLTVERTLENAELRKDHQFCKRQLQSQSLSSRKLIGRSAALEGVLAMVDAVASSDITVMVSGESGTGKELVARALHDYSGRAKRNFVAVDCCTLQEKLFESELFGHERGAFTGADRQKKGLIEGAEGGTLFLDEIGEIDATIQSKLLRILETGFFRRVGGTKDLHANVRVVAATNRNLESMAENGEFRSDLFYRLNGFYIHVPPLRDRREDIHALAEHFVRNHGFSGRIEKKLSPAALRKLVAYDWPGNVRELRNVIERSIILSREKACIKPEHLAFGSNHSKVFNSVSLSFDHDPTLAELDSRYLSIQLKKYSGRRAKVAEVLGISERSIYRMLSRSESESS